MFGFLKRRRVARNRNEGFVRRVAAILAETGIRSVIDVGANRGGFASSLRGCGFAGPIVSFEPGPSAHAALVATARRDKAWTVAPRMALADRSGTATLTSFDRDDMNSLLAASHDIAAAFPRLHAAEAVAVPLNRLDAVLDDVAPDLPEPALLKVDTQGSELAVLAGASGVLARCSALLLEAAVTPLYRSQPTLLDVIAAGQEVGFVPALVSEGYFSKRLNRHVDLDILFLRRKP